MDLKSTIRTIPDYPKPGIMFRDVTTLMGNGPAFREAIDRLVAHYKDTDIDKIAGIEARGFIFGAALADRLGVGFVPVRKHGKLPHDTHAETYELEYGQDTLEIHTDAIVGGERVLLLDDLLATGGTALAAASLVKKAGGTVIGAGFVIDLPEIGGRQKLEASGLEVHALIAFEGH